MNTELIEKIADAVLYEGYILYPYRPSSVKNQQRFNFGVLTPRSYSEAQRGTESWQMQTQVLLRVGNDTTFDVKVRFLHLRERKIYHSGEIGTEPVQVNSLEVNGKIYQTWQEAVEREVKVSDLKVGTLETKITRFTFDTVEEKETLLRDSSETATIFRTQKIVNGELTISAEKIGEDLFRLTVLISNMTEFDQPENKSRDEALAHSLVSTHTILQATEGEFISLLEPPAEYGAAVASCQNIDTYPVLAGEEGRTDAMLSSPIILYDYPEIAPESPGELFDGTEIDEILTLRIMTMTDEEKREMTSVDERARGILERTEAMNAQDLMKLHGVLRHPRAFNES